MSTPKAPKNGCPKSSLTPRSPVKGQTTLFSFVNRAQKRPLEEPEHQGASKIPKPTNSSPVSEEMDEPNGGKKGDGNPADINSFTPENNSLIQAILNLQTTNQSNFDKLENSINTRMTSIDTRMTAMDGKLDQIKNEFSMKTEEIEAKIAELENKIKNLGDPQMVHDQTKEMAAINDALEQLRIEARANNLIIHGMEEEEGELQEELKKNLAQIFTQHYGLKNPHFDAPQRLPTKNNRGPRPVKIHFTTREQRNSILYKKAENSPITVKADLPPETARKQKTFAIFKKLITEEGRRCKRFDTHVMVGGNKFDFTQATNYLQQNYPDLQNSPRERAQRSHNPRRQK